MNDDDDLLEEALGALRDDASDPSEATLGRILESLDGDVLLDEACAALRAQSTNAESMPEDDATLDRIHASLAGAAPLDATLDEAVDALRETRAPARRPRWALAAAAAVALAMVLGGPTAWAWSTGRLPAILATLGWSPREVAPPPPRPSRPPLEAPVETPVETPVEAPVVAPAHSVVAPAPAPVVAPAPAPVAPRVPPAPRRVDAPDPIAAAEPPALEAPDAPEGPEPDSPETRSFAAAFDAHRGGDPQLALRLWDAHLAAYPRGRFELEARYNRALTQLRLGRLDEAREALVPFAEGAHGAYRRAEAGRLVAALDEAMAARRIE
ncbi:MAG: hypothetical protein H6719_06270 [Sandaracinaceae bacterium]|nr:hypothetical protein [Sandaracinaceae bacterium]